MTKKHDITIARHFIEATQKVLNTMAFLEALPGKPISLHGKPGSAGDISAIVGVTGVCSGAISVSFSKEAALIVLQGMLGDEACSDEETMDAVGEIINMISGMARASLSEAGLIMQGSTPSVVSGKDHTILHQSKSPGIAIPFSLEGHTFYVEFTLDCSH